MTIFEDNYIDGMTTISSKQLEKENVFKNENTIVVKHLISPVFSDIKVSTQTIIAVSNFSFNLSNLYNYLPIVSYTIIKRKRGRKKNVVVLNPNINLPVGSIISVQNKTNVRGVSLRKKKDSKTYFLNSVTIICAVEDGKLINGKLSENGKWQITGCKTEAHFLSFVKYVYENIKKAEEYSGEKLYSLKNEETSPRVIFNIVMKNMDSKVGFSIQRDKLDTFMNMNTEFTSYFEGSITTGVNIKLPSKNPYEKMLRQIVFPSEYKEGIMSSKKALQ